MGQPHETSRRDPAGGDGREPGAQATVTFQELEITGAFLIGLEERTDDRGFFARAWCAHEFEDHGLSSALVQVNLSFNERAGTTRGMHYQRPPHEEAKCVRCTRGV